MYTWHVHKTEKFQYPINDVIVKHGKELVKTVLVTLTVKVLFKFVIKSTARSVTKRLTLIMFV